MEIRCVIVDDEQDAVDLLSGRLARIYKNLKIEEKFTNWEPALEYLKVEGTDILFIDISMPGKNGFDFLKLIPGFTGEIIFVTAHDNHALKAFMHNATGYILKPIDDADLSNAVDKAISRVENYRKAKLAGNTGYSGALFERIGLPNSFGIDFVIVNEILYLESENKCTNIITKAAKLVSTQNLGKFGYICERYNFFYQVHRSYIVNLNHVLRYQTSGLLIMSDKMEIPVSRAERTDLMTLFNARYPGLH